MRRACLIVLVCLGAGPLAAGPLAGGPLAVREAFGADLTTVGAGTVRETECTYAVVLDGLVARVTERHRFVLDPASSGSSGSSASSGSSGDAEAVYAFALPAGAAIVELTVAPPGVAAQPSAPVDAAAAITPAADRDTVAIAADLGLIRRLGALDADGDGLDAAADVAYELRAWPVGDRDATTVEITWIAPLTVLDGRLALRIPGRGAGDPLAGAKGTVRAIAPTGVKKLRDLRAGGDLVASKPGKKAVPFTAPQVGDLWIEVTPIVGTPVVAFSTAPLGSDQGALGVAVLRPRAAATAARFARVLFVVDGSLSAAGEPAARDAIATIVDGIAARAGDALVQTLVFDRTTRPLLDAFTKPTTSVRDKLRNTLTGMTARAGSDLRAALADARALLAGGDDATAGATRAHASTTNTSDTTRAHASTTNTSDTTRAHAGATTTASTTRAHAGATLVVVVTDGVLATDVTSALLAEPFADLPDVTISAVVLAPDELALPDPRTGVLAELARGTGGHVAAVRHAEATTRAATLADELGAVADWWVQAVRAGKAPRDADAAAATHLAGRTELSLQVPDSIAAGGGFVAFGWYRGKAPAKLTLETSDGLLTAKRSKLAGTAALAIAGPSEALLAPMTEAETERAMAALARRIGAVSARASRVVVDGRDELANARLALAAKGGTFSRMPPEPEDRIRVPEPRVAEIVDAGARYVQDTAARIRVDLLRPQLLPAVKRCYREALGGGGVAAGQVLLEIEIARGEVGAVRTSGAKLPKRLTACLADAGFALAVPSYTLTDGPDTIHLIRYPIVYKAGADPDAGLAIGEDGARIPIDLGDAADTPLGDLTSD